MFSVLIYSRSMKNFVTSRWAEMIFGTREECETYCLSSESFHPRDFDYCIRQRDGEGWRYIGGLMRTDDGVKIHRVGDYALA